VLFITDINPVHGSFLETDPNDAQFAQVEYLLLDPSCSGSGIISRLDHLVDDDDEEKESTCWICFRSYSILKKKLIFRRRQRCQRSDTRRKAKEPC
jgi:16S rRNA C967 or C1407 C5-methylase (RsmB/RsmF family)